MTSGEWEVLARHGSKVRRSLSALNIITLNYTQKTHKCLGGHICFVLLTLYPNALTVKLNSVYGVEVLTLSLNIKLFTCTSLKEPLIKKLKCTVDQYQ